MVGLYWQVQPSKSFESFLRENLGSGQRLNYQLPARWATMRAFELQLNFIHFVGLTSVIKVKTEATVIA